MLNEILTGQQVSSTFSPTSPVTDIVVSAGGAGEVWLEVQLPTSGAWVPITNKRGAFSVQTPDTGLTYRFRADLYGGEAEVYAGP